MTDKSSKTPADRLGRAVTAACLERGLHVNIVQLPGMGGIFRIAPPMTIEATDLHAGVDTLEAALFEVLSSTGAGARPRSGLDGIERSAAHDEVIEESGG